MAAPSAGLAEVEDSAHRMSCMIIIILTSMAVVLSECKRGARDEEVHD